jgi:hypothetical protein
VEEVKRTALAASAFVFISIQSFRSVIDPQALKVRQVCGTAAIASAQLSLRAEGSTSEIHVPTAHNGTFSFGNIPAGIYRLSTTWQEKNGNVQQPIHNSCPIKVIGTNAAAACRRPVWVDMLRGSESGLTVSFLK